METAQKRLFISDLPETLTKDELENAFSNYGQVHSIEIKERKELGPFHKSLFFAYINLSTDDRTLNDCFQDFKAKRWHGHYIQLQIARESFLDRLKRERLENKDKKSENLSQPNVAEVANLPKKTNIIKQISSTKAKPDSSSDSSDTSESDEEKSADVHKSVKVELEDKLDMVIKNNKHKILRDAPLRIASVGAKPIIEITKVRRKANGITSEADAKRLQSVRDMKKNYEAKKSLIKTALSYGTAKPNNKIVFDDDYKSDKNKAVQVNGVKKDSLFGEDSDDDFQANFDIKEQFDGSKGQKLLELQSRYEADKRFALDKRFIEDEETNTAMEMEQIDIEEEKSKELKILGEVLGKKFVPKSAILKNSLTARKSMVKFDPSQPEHSSLVITPTTDNNKSKKAKKEKRKEDEHPVESQKPEVSKEVFYKVTENLKETFTETPSQFSLLSMFQRPDHEVDDPTDNGSNTDYVELKPDKSVLSGKNPYKYDSSDDEDEIEDIPHKDAIITKPSQDTKTPDGALVRSSQAVFWTEPFFFKPDDFRLQEGFDFIEKVKMDSKEFTQIRRDVKGIVKAKVKNSERKNKMFKKKLGGSRKRKHIRMKKALKR